MQRLQSGVPFLFAPFHPRHGARRGTELSDAARPHRRKVPYDPLRSFANEVLPLHVTPELIHINDVVRHPLFPGHPLYAVGREVDLISRSATVALDPLSSETEESPFPFTPNILDD